MFGLPIVFTPFIISFPAGLILYWITTNVWTIGQQYVVKSSAAGRRRRRRRRSRGQGREAAAAAAAEEESAAVARWREPSGQAPRAELPDPEPAERVRAILERTLAALELDADVA